MKKTGLCLILIVLLGGAAALYFRIARVTPEPRLQAPPPQPPPTRYPIETSASPADALPALRDSDPAILDLLTELFGPTPERFFYLDDIIHRLVATIDNLPRDAAPVRLMPVKPVAGSLITGQNGEGLTLSPQNSARYVSYVRLAERIPTAPLVAAYTRFYPLFQQQYENLGYPDKYFNDRVVDVIDHLLATPEVKESPRLSRPKVLYEFADPQLQRLSAGQKILLRMGAENAARIKAKLHEIRTAVASPPE